MYILLRRFSAATTVQAVSSDIQKLQDYISPPLNWDDRSTKQYAYLIGRHDSRDGINTIEPVPYL